MKQAFKDKVVWITGASSGIGEALAYALSARGAKLILSSRRENELERVKANCQQPEQVKVLPLDLTDSAGLEAKVAVAIALFGQVDIMVHNGGITQRSLVADTDIEVHRRVMELDYFSYIILTKALLPHFLSRRSGHFVVTSSVMGKIGTPMRAAYAAAKHALHGYFDCLRAEVSLQGIKVTVLTPGYIRTAIYQSAVTGDGGTFGAVSQEIDNGYPADKAAEQIVKAISKGTYEAYIGRLGEERLALFVNRFLPNLLIRMMPGREPK
ncbi:SDR family oxidoreductase [Mucilaginibacter mali]|uniref:SDR family oxidoreductase n=1 Tax=Mucilaginibacter mali TaxID=2740462 RepID=A0A7D4QCD8_9SPHI|nr:SDR family oxidoreductase [Mucilaginibacter mali]QKJ32225.1 SDR family oxidoreductase [Mucilaginibacter mali]